MAKERVILERRYVPRGSIIIKEGDQAFSSYIIQSGEVSVYTEHDGKVIELSRLGMGEICGEMALINEGVRTASVKATEDCNLIVITKNAFEDRLEKSDTMIQSIVKMLIERVKSSNLTVTDKHSGVANLKNMVHSLHNNTLQDLNDKKAAKFEKMVKPKLDDLLKALDRFH